MSLAARAWIALVALAAIMGFVLFAAAGSLGYWQGWVYLVVFMGASLLTTLDLLKHDPALLERRMRGGPTAETRPIQRIIMLGASIGFVLLLAVPGLDHRFGWTSVPVVGVLLGCLLVAIGFYGVMRVYRENTFTSATIELAEDQYVISTGPYAVVRHPMYAGASLYVVGTPLALGSYMGFVAVAIMLPFIIWRLLDEERFLTTNLPGYLEYRQRVRYRLVPYVW